LAELNIAASAYFYGALPKWRRATGGADCDADHDGHQRIGGRQKRPRPGGLYGGGAFEWYDSLLGFVGDFADVSTAASVGSQALVVLGLRGWLSLLDEVCLQWVQQPDVTREQVVRFLEQSLHAIVAATTSRLVFDDTRDL
jgi:hypothetical protein